MADNFQRTAGSGEAVAGDEVTDATLGSCKVQFVKLMDGTLDGTDKCHVDATNGLKVDVSNASIAGTAGTPNAGVLSVQGITSGTNLAVMPQEAGKTRVSKRVAIAASGTGTTIWDPTTGWRFVLTKLWVSAKTAGDIQIFDSTDSANTVVSPIVSLNAGGGFVIEWPKDWPYRSAAVDNILKYTTGTVITGSIYVEGWEENA